MSLTELIIDTLEPEGNTDAMYIKPSRFNTTKYLAPNIFDQATIKHSTVEQITSNGLSGIFASLKPLGKLNIIVHQPIGVMVFYDSKQIEANLKLAGFENIKITDIKYQDEITKYEIQTQQLEAEKLLISLSNLFAMLNVPICCKKAINIKNEDPIEEGKKLLNLMNVSEKIINKLRELAANKNKDAEELLKILIQRDKL